MKDNVIPLSCTLTPQQFRDDRRDLLPGWIERATSVIDLDNGVKLNFTSQPGLLAELAGMIGREQSCCGFLRFRLDVKPRSAGVSLEVTGPEGTRELLRSW